MRIKSSERQTLFLFFHEVYFNLPLFPFLQVFFAAVPVQIFLSPPVVLLSLISRFPPVR